MVIDGLPEEISRQQLLAAVDALGLPADDSGKITCIAMYGDRVEVTFIREPKDRPGDVLVGGKATIAKVSVPIVVSP